MSLLTKIDYEHGMVHKGTHFVATHFIDNIDSTTYDHLLVVPAGVSVHFTCVVESSNYGLMTIYEDATTSNDGTAITIFNSDRNSSKTISSGVTFNYVPTVSGTGTAIKYVVMGSEAAPAGTVVVVPRSFEFILKASSKYLFRFAASNDNTELAMQIALYERV